MKRIKTILFDWDGCLGQTLDIWVESWLATFKNFDVDVNKREVVNSAFLHWREPIEMGIENSEMFYETLYTQVETRMNKVKLYPGVKKTLEELGKHKVTMAVVTSSRRSLVEPVLERLKVRNYFEVIIGEEETKNPKPNPEVVNKALKTMMASHDNAMIVGDGENDIVAGRRANIKTGLFFPNINKKFYDEKSISKIKPDYFFREMQEILELVG